MISKPSINLSILVAVAQRDVAPWREIRLYGQELTWVKHFRRSGVRVVYYLAQEPNAYQKMSHRYREFSRFRKNLGRIQGKIDKTLMRLVKFKEPDFKFLEERHELHVSCPSTYLKMHERNFALFKWFLEENNEEFLFRTNTSSYLNQAAISSYMNTIKNLSSFLGGTLSSEGEHGFISGAGILMPRQTIREILNNWNMLERHIIEDVALSRLSRRLGIPLIDLPRLDFNSPNLVERCDGNVLSSNFHFRCKGSIRPRQDIEIMKLLDAILS